MQNQKKVSWGWIIFWCLFFFPVGIFLIFSRLKSDKAATLNNSKTVLTISYVLMVFSLVSLTAIPTEGSTMISAFLVYGIGGAWLYRVGRKMKATGERYKKYITLVINQNMTVIDSIAPSLGLTYEEAKSDLQTMIDLGYFEGAFINESTRQIMLSKNMTEGSSKASSQSLVCRSCGANNTITIGRVSECNYCGTSLH